MARPNLKFDASSRCRHPTKTGPSKSKTRSSKNVGKPEFRLTRVLRFPDRTRRTRRRRKDPPKGAP
eukprot:7031677-Pyramimonas_sp.AAC.1